MNRILLLLVATISMLSLGFKIGKEYSRSHDFPIENEIMRQANNYAMILNASYNQEGKKLTKSAILALEWCKKNHLLLNANVNHMFLIQDADTAVECIDKNKPVEKVETKK